MQEYVVREQFLANLKPREPGDGPDISAAAAPADAATHHGGYYNARIPNVAVARATAVDT